MLKTPPLRAVLAIITGIISHGLIYRGLISLYTAIHFSNTFDEAVIAHITLLIILPSSLFAGALITGMITSLEGWWLALVWVIPVASLELIVIGSTIPDYLITPGLLAITIAWILAAGFLGGNIGGAIGRLYRETGGGLPRETLRGPRDRGVDTG